MSYSKVTPNTTLEVDGPPFGDRNKKERFLTRWNLMVDSNADVTNVRVIWDMFSLMDQKRVMFPTHFWRQVPHRILVVDEKMGVCHDFASMAPVYD